MEAACSAFAALPAHTPASALGAPLFSGSGPAHAPCILPPSLILLRLRVSSLAAPSSSSPAWVLAEASLAGLRLPPLPAPPPPHVTLPSHLLFFPVEGVVRRLFSPALPSAAAPLSAGSLQGGGGAAVRLELLASAPPDGAVIGARVLLEASPGFHVAARVAAFCPALGLHLLTLLSPPPLGFPALHAGQRFAACLAAAPFSLLAGEGEGGEGGEGSSLRGRLVRVLAGSGGALEWGVVMAVAPAAAVAAGGGSSSSSASILTIVLNKGGALAAPLAELLLLLEPTVRHFARRARGLAGLGSSLTRAPRAHLGIINCSGTCYLGAALQALQALPTFTALFLGLQGGGEAEAGAGAGASSSSSAPALSRQLVQAVGALVGSVAEGAGEGGGAYVPLHIKVLLAAASGGSLGGFGLEEDSHECCLALLNTLAEGLGGEGGAGAAEAAVVAAEAAAALRPCSASGGASATLLSPTTAVAAGSSSSSSSSSGGGLNLRVLQPAPAPTPTPAAPETAISRLFATRTVQVFQCAGSGTSSSGEASERHTWTHHCQELITTLPLQGGSGGCSASSSSASGGASSSGGSGGGIASAFFTSLARRIKLVSGRKSSAASGALCAPPPAAPPPPPAVPAPSAAAPAPAPAAARAWGSSLSSLFRAPAPAPAPLSATSPRADLFGSSSSRGGGGGAFLSFCGASPREEEQGAAAAPAPASARSPRHQAALPLPLPLPRSAPRPLTLAQLLSSTWGASASERVTVSCASCAAQAALATTFLAPPLPANVLLTLKRFEAAAPGSGGALTKNSTPMAFPLTLSLAPYLAPAPLAAPGAGSPPPPRADYELRSVVVHLGELQRGHYVAYLRLGQGGWACADDSSVVEVGEEALAAPDVLAGAYMLLYARREMR